MLALTKRHVFTDIPPGTPNIKHQENKNSAIQAFLLTPVGAQTYSSFYGVL